MTAYAVVTLTVTDPDMMAQYREVAGPSMAKHGASALHVSAEPKQIEGEGPAPQIIVLLTFPDRKAAEQWHNDPEIAHVRALRQGAADSRIFLL
ncbi:MAG: DUF1330 domain-containing protein [Sulfitobacter sp.]